MSTLTFSRTELLAGTARARLIEDSSLRRGFKAGNSEELRELLELKNAARQKALEKHLIAKVEAELKELGINIED